MTPRDELEQAAMALLAARLDVADPFVTFPRSMVEALEAALTPAAPSAPEAKCPTCGIDDPLVVMRQDLSTESGLRRCHDKWHTPATSPTAPEACPQCGATADMEVGMMRGGWKCKASWHASPTAPDAAGGGVYGYAIEGPGNSRYPAIYEKLDDAQNMAGTPGGFYRVVPLYAHPPLDAVEVTRMHEALSIVAKAAGYETAWLAPSGTPNIILERKHPTEAGKIQITRLDIAVSPAVEVARMAAEFAYADTFKRPGQRANTIEDAIAHATKEAT